MLRRPLFWLVLLAIATFVGVSHADDADEEVQDFSLDHRWVPSATLAVTVHQENGDLNANNEFEFSFKRNETPSVVTVRFGGELMSPTRDELPLKPRFFASLGLLWSAPGNGLTHLNHDTDSVNDYRDVNIGLAIRSFDEQEITNPSIVRSITDFEGRGTQIQGRQTHNAWFAGVGTAFTFPRSGFTIRVRPSLEYVGEKFRTEGEYTLLEDNGPAPRLVPGPRFDIHRAADHKTEIHHSLGPGLELEFVNHLDGNLTLSFFTQTRFLWIVNDRKTTLKGDDNLGTPYEFSFKRQRFNFRGGVGVRLGFRNLTFASGS